MEIYKMPIEVAIITFPFIAFLFTLPFLIHEYRKYGAVPILKSVIVYSMILYLLCAYFLVILPLPPKNEVANYTSNTTQLIPFNFINDIKLTTTINIKDFNSILTFLNTSSVFTVIFNIFLTIPFGVYLKYLFNIKWYQTVILTFLLSLFFELTQLSGLYGIYPRPYRLFDVDDLIINTLGGLIGHLITPIFLLFIPNKDKLNEKSYIKGKKVTILRRFISLFIDLFFILPLFLIIKVVFINTDVEQYSYIFTIILYYFLIPLLNNTRTLGQTIVKIAISGLGDKFNYLNLTVRNFLLSFFVLYPFSWLSICYDNVSLTIFILILVILSIFYIFNIIIYICPIDDQHLFLYEWISKTKCKSTINMIDENKIIEKTSDNDD